MNFWKLVIFSKIISLKFKSKYWGISRLRINQKPEAAHAYITITY